nr:C1 family peptidase [Kitasatospora sp. MBT63]
MQPVRDEGLCPDSEGYATAAVVESAVEIATGQHHNYVYAPEDEPDHLTPGRNTLPCTLASLLRPENPPGPRKVHWTQIPAGDENAIKAAVSQGPVVVSIAGENSDFRSFSGEGILDNPSCPRTIDHVVSIVGYGTQGGVDYWIVKNSWGTSWGKDGFGKIARGKNTCGIASAPSWSATV